MKPAFAYDLATTGVPGLDSVLRGGIPRRHIYLLQGDPGVGKTTLALQFLIEGVRQGEKTLYVTLSETEQELTDVAASHGWTLDGIAIHQLASPEEMLDLQNQNTLFHPAEVELHETISKVMQLVDKVQPTRVVLDSLSELRLLAGDSLRYRRQILAFKQAFVGRRSTVFFLDDGTGEDSDNQLASIAHGVIELTRDTPEYGTVRRRLEIVKLRGVDFMTGRHDFAMLKSGVTVYPRLVAAEYKREFSRNNLSSGSPALDGMLGGGLVTGTSTLLLGPPGSGKSSVAMQYLGAALKKGIRVAHFTFDENLATVFARAKEMGVDLAQAVDTGNAVVRQVDPAEMSPGEFACLVKQTVEKEKVGVVVVDSLNGYLMAMPNERFLVIHMHELLTYLAQQGVTTMLVVAQHGLVGSMQAPVDVTYLADSVVLFRFFEAAGKVRKSIAILKKRVGAHEDSIREFQVNGSGIVVGKALTAFHGVLTGVPQFTGDDEALMKI